MKKILLAGMATACALMLWGQGTLQLTAGATLRSTGGAWLVLDNMHLVNGGALQQTAGNGRVKLTGSLSVNLSGSSPTTFDSLVLAKGGASALHLLRSLSVVSGVRFSGGIINLGDSILNLGTTGAFVGESETSRAFTSGNGYVQVSGNLNAPSNVNLGNLGAEISSPVNMGATTIRRGHKQQTGFPGTITPILRYFDILPNKNVNLKATLRFRYFDAELNGNIESALTQWKSTNLVTWEVSGADARDTIANFVTRANYSKFDRTTLAPASGPTITCPADTVVSSNAKGCKATVSFAATATGNPTPTITYRIGNTVITSPHLFPKGTTTVTATASNGVEPNATCTFTVTVVCGPVTMAQPGAIRVEETTATTHLTLTARPNPTASYFTLDVRSSNPAPVTIRVVDATGRVVAVWSNVAARTSLDIGHRYRPGIYYVEAIQGKEKATLKLLKGTY